MKVSCLCKEVRLTGNRWWHVFVPVGSGSETVGRVTMWFDEPTYRAGEVYMFEINVPAIDTESHE